MVEVKTQKPDQVDPVEMEKVYRHLSHFYCVCNHHKNKHVNNEYECKHEAMRGDADGIQTFRCECKFFVSLQDKALDIPPR